MSRKFDRTRGIGDVAGGMLAAIDLDRQFPCRAGEIHHVMTDRMLAAELPRLAFGAQGVPETLLGVGGVAAQTAGRGSSLSPHWHKPPTSPRPSPPRGAEREFAPALVRMCESNSLSAPKGGEGQGEVGDSPNVRITTCSAPSMFPITSLFQNRMTR
jgi:hypothetical protein